MTPRPIKPRFFLPAAAFVAAVAVFGARPAAAQGSGCPPFGRPAVQVDFQVAALQRDDSRASAQLASMPGRAPGPAGASGGNILGLAHAVYGTVEGQSPVQYMTRPLRDCTVCAALSSIKVTFGFKERIVFVARELPRGTCIHTEVLAHEMKHVATDEGLLKDYAPIIRQKLETVAARMSPVRARSGEQAMHALQRPLDAALKELMQAFSRERDRRQARVDTIEEYKRVSGSCNGELGKYLKGKTKL